jgi:hypothetical protein
MSIAVAMAQLRVESERASTALDQLVRQLHDISHHDPEHRAGDLRWCFAGQVRACACVHEEDHCCAAATQEDWLCDRCRAEHRGTQ